MKGRVKLAFWLLGLRRTNSLTSGFTQFSKEFSCTKPFRWRRSSCAHSSLRRRRHRRCLALQGAESDHSTIATPDIVEYSNFWGNVVRKGQGGEIHAELVSSHSPPPCLPTLDPFDGPLPSGCFLQPRQDEDSLIGDPKPICRLSVAVDLQQRHDRTEWNSDEVIRNMQRFIDSGLTSFQLAYDNNNDEDDIRAGDWGVEHIYGRLLQDTPSHVTKNCHLVVPWLVRFREDNKMTSDRKGPKDAYSAFTKKNVREIVLEKLRRTGGEAIDTLQLKSDDGIFESPYAMDVLDILSDLKRDGYLRSIAIATSMNPPVYDNLLHGQDGINKKQFDIASFFRSVETYGFGLEAWQMTGNILTPPQAELAQLPKLSSVLNNDHHNMITVLSSPLAGGLLTDRHVGKVRFPTSRELRKSERSHWQSTLSNWQQRRNGQDNHPSKTVTSKEVLELEQHLWQKYQEEILDDFLGYIALKHQVSIASVALRWAIQGTPRGSAVATCRLASAEDEEGRIKQLSLRHRPAQFREVFRFELDEEDINMLNELSSSEQQQQNTHATGLTFPGFPDGPEWEEADEEYLEALMEQMEQQGQTDHPIDFNNRQLWL